MQVSEKVRDASVETATALSRVEKVLQVARQVRYALQIQGPNSSDLIDQAFLTHSDEREGIAVLETVLGDVQIISTVELNKDIDAPSVRIGFFHKLCGDDGVFLLEVDFQRNILTNYDVIGYTVVPSAQDKDEMKKFIYYLKAAVLAELMERLD